MRVGIAIAPGNGPVARDGDEICAKLIFAVRDDIARCRRQILDRPLHPDHAFHRQWEVRHALVRSYTMICCIPTRLTTIEVVIDTGRFEGKHGLLPRRNHQREWLGIEERTVIPGCHDIMRSLILVLPYDRCAGLDRHDKRIKEILPARNGHYGMGLSRPGRLACVCCAGNWQAATGCQQHSKQQHDGERETLWPERARHAILLIFMLKINTIFFSLLSFSTLEQIDKHEASSLSRGD